MIVEARNGKCDKTCIFGKVSIIIYEILFTIKIILIKLGLGKISVFPPSNALFADLVPACVLVYLKPLLLALIGLIKALDKVVLGLLIAVGGIVNALLAALGLGLLGIII